jgi:hypothetical protein
VGCQPSTSLPWGEKEGGGERREGASRYHHQNEMQVVGKSNCGRGEGEEGGRGGWETHHEPCQRDQGEKVDAQQHV